MKRTVVVVLLTVGWLLPGGVLPDAGAQPAVVVHPDSSLQAAVDTAGVGQVIHLPQGVYRLTSSPYVEPTCGNCDEPATEVHATVGLRVTGRGIRIVGEGRGSTTIRTNAGYGILFEDCLDCTLEGVTVTGGTRDPSPAATDAAVVVKQSKVLVTDCTLENNIGDPGVVTETVVGIAGIVGREGAELAIRRNRILRNSWDGIALYRGAKAEIRSNVIDGVDLARGSRVGGGRGVGIGVTWDANANIQGNLVRHYWKGIGIFVDAQVLVEENVVEHVATWGLSLWDAGKGKPAGFFMRNVVYDTGACGASIIREGNGEPFPGRFVQNVLVQTGQDPRYDSGEPYCYQAPVAAHAVPADFTIAGNIHYRNRTPEGNPAPDDVTDEAFRHRILTLANLLGPWAPVRESDFWREFVLAP